MEVVFVDLAEAMARGSTHFLASYTKHGTLRLFTCNSIIVMREPTLFIPDDVQLTTCTRRK